MWLLRVCPSDEARNTDVYFGVYARVAGAAAGTPDAHFSPHPLHAGNQYTGHWFTPNARQFVYSLYFALAQAASIELVLHTRGETMRVSGGDVEFMRLDTLQAE